MLSDFPSRIRSSPTALTLLGANILVMIFALALNWSVLQIMWIYLIQSVIIGFFSFLKLLHISFSSKSVFYIIGGLLGSLFFVVHYGGFHLGYAVFLTLFSVSGGASHFFVTSQGVNTLFMNLLPAVLLGSAVFFVNHLFSFLFYLKRTGKSKKTYTTKDFNDVMLSPYPRIIPMHLTIIFGGALISFGMPIYALVIFLVLKTIVDLIMHLNEHKDEI